MDNPQIKTEKLLKYGKKQLTDKGVETQATTIREVLDGISNVKAEEPTQYGAYNIEVIHKGDGTQELHITDAVEKPVGILQARVDETKSCAYLFYQYFGTNSNIASNLNTNNVTDIAYMFSSCVNLTSLDLSNFDTSKVIGMNSMFYYCSELTSLDLSNFDTSKVRDMGYMFYYCANLTSILGILDLIKVTNTSNMFHNCKVLTNVTLKNIKTNLQIGSGTAYGHLLTLDTLINTINELWDYSGGSTTYKLTIGSANLEKIANTYVKLITPTEEQTAADPNITSKKPCVICDSTEEGAMLISEYAYLKMWSIV